LVTAGDFFFPPQRQGFLPFSKKPFELTLVTQDYDGKPLAQTFQERPQRGNLDPIPSKYDYKKTGSATSETAADGEGKVSLDFQKGGNYRLAVSGKDHAGRKVLFYDYLWVSGSAEDSEDFGLQRELKVVADKKKYEVGETAKIFLV